MYERVCELREQRLDEEDAAAGVGHAVEGLRKDIDVLCKKTRVAEQALAVADKVRKRHRRFPSNSSIHGLLAWRRQAWP